MCTTPEQKARRAERQRAFQTSATGKASCKAYKAKYARTLKHFLAHSKSGAKKRNIPFNITLEDVEQLAEKQWMLCALSGVELELEVGHPNRLSIDRKDSALGYMVDNIQLVTTTVNYAKNNQMDAAFIEMCVNVARNHKQCLSHVDPFSP